MKEDPRCQLCGQTLPGITRTEFGRRFFRRLYPGAVENSDGDFILDGETYSIRTSKLNAQSDRKRPRWSFSKGSGTTATNWWLWIGLNSSGDTILRAWAVPEVDWTTKVTHVSESPRSQWAPYQCFPSKERTEPIRAHEIKENGEMTMPQNPQGWSLQHFVRGQFRRFVALMKINVGSLSNSQQSTDIERGQYIHFDGYTLRFNGDDPNSNNWQDFPAVKSKSIISSINNGWLIPVEDGQQLDVSQWSYRPPSAGIQMRPADEMKAMRQGQQYADGSLVHQEDQAVGSVGGFVNHVNQHNQQAWDRRFANQGNPVQVGASNMGGQAPQAQGRVITSSTAGGYPAGPTHNPQMGQAVPPPGYQGGPQFVAQPPPPVRDHAAMNPQRVGYVGGSVEVQDARPVNVPIRVPAKQTANIATGDTGSGVYNSRGEVAPRPAVTTVFSTMQHQGVAGQGMVRDTHGNVLGSSHQFNQYHGLQQVQPFNPGMHPQFNQQNQQYQNQQYQNQQYQNQQYHQPPNQMTSEGVRFSTQGIGPVAQRATGTYAQPSHQAFGSDGMVVGRVGHTRPQMPLQPGQMLAPNGQPLPVSAQAATVQSFETPVVTNPDGSPMIVTAPDGSPMMLMRAANGQTQMVAPMAVPGPNGDMILVPPGQTVSNQQIEAAAAMAEDTDLNPEDIELPEAPEVPAELQAVVAAAQPTQAEVAAASGPPPVHPEALEILKGKKPIKDMETRVIGAKMFWPNFPDNWPFKSKEDVRMKLAELHQEHAVCLKAIYMAESTKFQQQMLDRWPDLLS